MLQRRSAAVVLASFVAAATIGCGGPSNSLEKLPVGQQQVVESSADERPGWLTQPPEPEDGTRYFSGGETDARDLDNSFRQARAEAWQTLGESLMGTFSSLLQQSEMGGNQALQEYSRNFQELAVNQLQVHGVQPQERYYEKVAERTGSGIEYHYNAFVLLEIPERQWRTAQLRALEEIQGEANGPGSEAAREFIEEAIKRLREMRSNR